MVFAGGDPSIRPDIADLVTEAHGVGLIVEIQTNAQAVRPAFREALNRADVIGLSLDGGDAQSHDSFRGKPGNFDRVVSLLRELMHQHKQVVLRTVISQENASEGERLAEIVEQFPNIVRWSLLEFSPIGEGFVNRDRYRIRFPEFEAAAQRVRATYRGTAELDVYAGEAKLGTYLLITPAGDAYGTSTTANEQGRYRVVGSIVEEHLEFLAGRLPFSAGRHAKRYKRLVDDVAADRSRAPRNE